MAKQTKHNNKKTHTFIDLFAGCGGLTLGLEQAGFKSIFFNEIEPVFASTYMANREIEDGHYFVGDINQLNENLDSYKHIWEDIDGGVDLVCGGPPCQGFSNANRQRVIDDPRNGLYKAYLKFLSAVRPKVFIMENVKGMAQRIDEIKDNFKEYLGKEYVFEARVLKAQEFGVPQNRERLIFIGNRLGVDPNTIFDAIYAYKREAFTLGDALRGLPHLEARKEKNSSDKEELATGLTERPFTYEKNDFYRFINGDRDITTLYNHKNRYNNERDIEIYRRLPQGANSLHESIQDIMPYKRRLGIFKDKYFKLDETQICKTITSHMKYDCNMYIHPWEARGLSPREAARIQTFPDDYVILGAQNRWYAQVGNAVPVKLAEAIGKGILDTVKL
ncbi:MAG: DNA cytosine methyltransferase [Bacteroidia bacterium]|nr:DNA cytosine methyltransferase [Bacteroidia bacterium]